MQYITTFYVPFHTSLGIINSTSFVTSMGEWGRRQYKVGINRPTCLRFSRCQNKEIRYAKSARWDFKISKPTLIYL